MTGAEKARWLASWITDLWETLGEPCAKATKNQALSYTEAEGVRCKFVDPDGLVAEPAYDLAIPMREYNQELLSGDATQLGHARCELLAELTGVDSRAIWQWGFIERVSTGLGQMQIGTRREGLETLAVADQWAMHL